MRAALSTASSTARPCLLVVDDEPHNIELVARAFREQFDVHQALDGEEALALARTIRPDVIITDQRMPKVSGVEFLTRIKEELPRAVRVLITGYTDYGALVDAVNAADVHHYFEKPFHTVDLKTVVDSLLRTRDLEFEREALVARLEAANHELNASQVHLQEVVETRTKDLVEANQQLRELAVRDGLTGLFNHRYLIEHLEIELARSFRYSRVFGLLFIDVDDFKAVNDRHGHTAGDQVLCQIADLLRPSPQGLRHSDFAARYGGEEFCIILPETPLAGAQTKAERLCRAIAASDWQRVVPALERPITASVGVAAYPQHGETVESLIAAADEALYEAKRAGKNCVRVAAAGAPAPDSSERDE